MTARDGDNSAGRDDWPLCQYGASVFGNSDRRLNEIDWETYRHPKTVGEWTPEDWRQAMAALYEFERERGLR